MDITMRMIADRLEVLRGVKRFGYFPEDGLSIPRLFDSDIVATEKSLMVSKASILPEIPEIPKSSLLICAGITDNPRYHANKFPFIEVPDIPLSALFYEVQNIYLQFQKWETKANMILQNSANVEELLQAALLVLENPIFVADANMNYLAQAFFPEKLSFNGQALQIDTGGYGAPAPASNVQDVYNRIHKRGYDIEPRLCEDYGNAVYSIDLFFGAIHIGQLSVLRAVRDFYPSDVQLLKLLARQVEKSFQIRSTIIESRQITLKNILDAMLHGQKVDVQRLYNALPAPDVPQSLTNRFWVLYVEDASDVFSRTYLRKRFEHEIVGSFTLSYRDGLICLIDSCVSPDSVTQLESKLLDLSRELSIAIGTSRWFSDISQFLAHVRQAYVASTFPCEPNTGMRSFDKAAFPYMLRKLSSEFTSAELAPEGFIPFLDFCDNKDYDYFHLLEVYLENFCNASLSAEKMYMNRSTFLKRLSHIRVYLGHALDDQQELLRLSICMKLRKHEMSKHLSNMV